MAFFDIKAIDDFLADFESANGQAFVNGLNLTDGSHHQSWAVSMAVRF